MTHQQDVADRLAQLRREKSARERRDVLQGEIAEQIGISSETYSRYENGKRKVPEDVVVALANFYATSPAFIRYGVVAQPIAEGQFSEAEIAAARARVAAREGAHPLKPEALEAPPDDPPARAVAGARKRPKRPRD